MPAPVGALGAGTPPRLEKAKGSLVPLIQTMRRTMGQNELRSSSVSGRGSPAVGIYTAASSSSGFNCTHQTVGFDADATRNNKYKKAASCALTETTAA